MTSETTALDVPALLRNVPFLADADDATIRRLAARVQERKLARGETICREGQACAAFWIVLDGSASLIKTGFEGRVQILETCSGGCTCALVAAIDRGPCPTTVKAREETNLLFVPSDALEASVRENPELGLAIARYLAGRLRTTIGQAASVCLRSVRSRTAAFLLDEATGRGTRADDGTYVVRLSARQEEIAQRLGTVREVLARTLRSFRDEGLIAQRRDVVTILDATGLKGAASS